MEDKPGYQDMRGTALFSEFKWAPEHICVWPWEDAPDSAKSWSTSEGDEDGVAWIPIKFLSSGDSYYVPYMVEKLWDHEQDVDQILFSDGMLVIWAHS